MTGGAQVVSVSRDGAHRFSKPAVASVRLLAGLGIEGDAHAGQTVQHRSRVAVDPTQPNLRQVHLIQSELFLELAAAGFDIGPGDMGENVLTSGLDLLSLPTGTRLRLGRDAVVVLTGLRNPCAQLDRFRPGLMRAVLGRDAAGAVVRKAGVMAVVAAGGEVIAGDRVVAEIPPEPHRPLERV